MRKMCESGAHKILSIFLRPYRMRQLKVDLVLVAFATRKAFSLADATFFDAEGMFSVVTLP